MRALYIPGVTSAKFMSKFESIEKNGLCLFDPEWSCSSYLYAGQSGFDVLKRGSYSDFLRVGFT